MHLQLRCTQGVKTLLRQDREYVYTCDECALNASRFLKSINRMAVCWVCFQLAVHLFCDKLEPQLFTQKRKWLNPKCPTVTLRNKLACPCENRKACRAPPWPCNHQVFVVFSPFVTWCSVMQWNHHFIYRSVCLCIHHVADLHLKVSLVLHFVSERGRAGVSDSESCKDLWPTISKTKPSAADWTNFSENSKSNNKKHCPDYDQHLWESKQNKGPLQEAKHFFSFNSFLPHINEASAYSLLLYRL